MLDEAFTNSSDHWRERATMARTVAEQITDPEAKAVMLEIAAGFDRLAEIVQMRLISKPSG